MLFKGMNCSVIFILKLNLYLSFLVILLLINKYLICRFIFKYVFLIVCIWILGFCIWFDNYMYMYVFKDFIGVFIKYVIFFLKKNLV